MATAAKTIAGLVDAVALRSPSRVALKSPFQSQKFTYGEIRRTTNALAGWLQLYGFEKNDLIVSDLPNVSENLILQLACNRIGVGYATAKNIEGMTKFPKVKGSAISDLGTGFLADTTLPLPPLTADFLVDLIHNGGLDDFQDEKPETQETEELQEGKSIAHGFYNSTSPFTNQQAIEQGENAAFELAMCESDVICISITLCHAFGMGSAVCSSFSQGATIVLPAVGGIQGCGVPSERASATLEVLKSEQCTLMFADSHTLKALPEPDHLVDLVLRGGVCKTGSGSTFLEETRKYAGITLRTIGGGSTRKKK